MNQPPPLERPTATHDDCDRTDNKVKTTSFFTAGSSLREEKEYEKAWLSQVSPYSYVSSDGLTINLFAAILLPLSFEVLRVLIGARIDSHYDAAFLET
jgi:hypothetical protein